MISNSALSRTVVMTDRVSCACAQLYYLYLLLAGSALHFVAFVFKTWFTVLMVLRSVMTSNRNMLNAVIQLDVEWDLPTMPGIIRYSSSMFYVLA